eukprot:1154747-Pelagomonas_calceolata.AAC.5
MSLPHLAPNLHGPNASRHLARYHEHLGPYAEGPCLHFAGHHQRPSLVLEHITHGQAQGLACSVRVWAVRAGSAMPVSAHCYRTRHLQAGAGSCLQCKSVGGACWPWRPDDNLKCQTSSATSNCAIGKT